MENCEAKLNIYTKGTKSIIFYFNISMLFTTHPSLNSSRTLLLQTLICHTLTFSFLTISQNQTGLRRANSVFLPNSTFCGIIWYLEIGHSRSIYTTELSRCYKQRLLLFRYQHITVCNI